MNWPEAAEGEETGFANRIPAANQIQRIFPLTGFYTGSVRIDFALPRSSKMPVKAASCPLSVQWRRKLMQKIHRLTDN
jgi:hypothetical protein